MSKKDFIKLEISLDDQKIPERIEWSASGNESGAKKEQTKSFFLTMFDPDTRDTMQMDMWTKDMQVIEMDRFVYQSLNALSDLYFRATRNKELANDMKKFTQYFGQKTEIITQK